MHSTFTIFVEYRMRLGIVKPKMKFSFASALSFRYICCNLKYLI